MHTPRKRRTLLDPPHLLSLPFPHQERIARVLRAFERFLAEPQDYKDAWTLGRDAEGQPEYGYFRREKRAGSLDNKETFHYRTNLLAMLRGACVRYDPHRELIEAAHELYACCRIASRRELFALAKELARKEENPHAFVRDFADRVKRADRASMPVLRIQRYTDENAAGSIIATRHADKSYTTLTVYASEPGLEFGTDYETLSDFTAPAVEAGHALYFGGRKALAHTGGRVPALLHQVRATSGNLRINIVFFDHVDCATAPRWYPHAAA